MGGVPGSIKLINSVIRDRLVGMDTQYLEEIDDLLLEIDGTDHFDNIGSNTAEVTSLAVAKAAAASLQTPLYRYMRGDKGIGVPHQMPNIIGGGATMGDAAWKGRTPDIQDHIILPIGCRSSFEEMLFVSKVYHGTGVLLRDIDPSFSGGRDEEYCWIPRIDDVTALEVLQIACSKVAAEHGISFRLGLDVGAADLWIKTGTLVVTLECDSYVTDECIAAMEIVLTDDREQIEDARRNEGKFAGVTRLDTDIAAMIAEGTGIRQDDGQRIMAFNLGIALEDVATAAEVYRRAAETNTGISLSV